MAQSTNGNKGIVWILILGCRIQGFIRCLFQDHDDRWEEIDIPVPWGQISGEFSLHLNYVNGHFGKSAQSVQFT